MSTSTATQFGTDCVAMLHANEADGATTAVNATGKPNASSTDSLNSQIDEAQKKFGTASMNFLNTGAGTGFGHGVNAVFHPGAVDITIDFQVRWDTSVAAAGFVCRHFNNSNTWGVAYTGANLAFTQIVAGTPNISIVNAWLPSADTWYHVAVVRSGNDYLMFVDGTQIGITQTDADSIVDNSGGMRWGQAHDGVAFRRLVGWIDEARYVIGTAVWTSNFTPPSAAYTPISVAGKMMLLGIS